MTETTVDRARLEAESARLRDAYARRAEDGRYSCFNDTHLLAVQERERVTLALLKRHGYRSLGDCRVLEVGCGYGTWLRDLIKWGAQPQHIVGVDVLADRIDEARRLCPEGVQVRYGNAASLEVPPGSFDLVLQSMLLTSVLDPEVRRGVARAMLRAMRPNGLILWYDYHVSNPRNPDVRGVSRREIKELFPDCGMELRRVTLAAPVARAILPRSRTLYGLLRSIPLLRSHYLGVIWRNDSRQRG